MAPSSDLNDLLYALATLRLALPSTLLAILAVAFLSKGFLAMMNNLQRQGWTQEEEDEYVPPRNTMGTQESPAKDGEADAALRGERKVRRKLVLALFYVVAGTYSLDGVAQG